MDIIDVGLSVAQLAGTLGGLVWLARRNTGQLDRLSSDINDLKVSQAVIQNTLSHHADIREDVKKDHDKLIVVEQVVATQGVDIAEQHGIIRRHRAELEKMIKMRVVQS